jgi:hypothetical protein
MTEAGSHVGQNASQSNDRNAPTRGTAVVIGRAAAAIAGDQ